MTMQTRYTPPQFAAGGAPERRLSALKPADLLARSERHVSRETFSARGLLAMRAVRAAPENRCEHDQEETESEHRPRPVRLHADIERAFGKEIDQKRAKAAKNANPHEFSGGHACLPVSPRQISSEGEIAYNSGASLKNMRP